jgi:hypothetical protein
MAERQRHRPARARRLRSRHRMARRTSPKSHHPPEVHRPLQSPRVRPRQSDNRQQKSKNNPHPRRRTGVPCARRKNVCCFSGEVRLKLRRRSSKTNLTSMDRMGRMKDENNACAPNTRTTLSCCDAYIFVYCFTLFDSFPFIYICF